MSRFPLTGWHTTGLEHYKLSTPHVQVHRASASQSHCWRTSGSNLHTRTVPSSAHVANISWAQSTPPTSPFCPGSSTPAVSGNIAGTATAVCDTSNRNAEGPLFVPELPQTIDLPSGESANRTQKLAFILGCLNVPFGDMGRSVDAE